MKIPNAEHAIVDIRKLRNYSLNSKHNSGKHKARVFSSALGITNNDAEELREVLLQAVKTSEAQVGQRDSYGQRYIVDFILDWQGKRAKIRSTWIIDPGSDVPRLTSTYIL